MNHDLYLLAVDIGTSFIKAAIYDTKGHCKCVTKEEVRSDQSMAGIFVQHGDEIFDSVYSCIGKIAKQFGEDSKKIAAIGFTGQMAGFMGADENWNDITTWSCSLDTRYLPYAERQMKTMEQEFLEIGGTNSPLMAPKCEWYVTDFQEEAEKVKKYMLISSYVVGRLGRCDIKDATLASSYATWTGLADIKSGCWSEELCEKSGISVDLLPELRGATDICGYLSADYADALGLTPEIPLVAGAGDKVAGCAGTGIFKDGEAIFETSSYGALSVLQKEYRPNKERKDYDAIPACTPGDFYLHRYLPGSGITLKWFMDTFQSSYGVMEEEMQQIEAGSEGLMAIGLLGGSAMPLDGSIKGTWIGHTWSHTKAHFYHALLESYAYELKSTMDSIAVMYPEWNRKTPVHVIGGGVGSKVWMQMLADVTGCDMLVHEEDDQAMWGAALLAGKGIGVFEDLVTGSTREETSIHVVTPNPEEYQKYQKYANLYETLKEDLKDTYLRMQNVSNF